ncbi:hypothetical protein [Priestia koreensis]|uniref:Uncharacterized protein n=1 Tax=Priestia koreensis TaxID=284581 RepID=A0A0M0KWD4_9BACI|nr:hypothetical protein [Priestia koreensis]KOO42698.1 hypothetical protein AMD01_16255 [Priestia koreensis]
MVKSIIVRAVVPFIVLCFLLGYMYPFSSISVAKSIAYEPDQVFVKEYVHSLKDLDKIRTFKDEDTRLAVNMMIKELHAKWVTSASSLNMGKSELNAQIIQLTHIYDQLLKLRTKHAQNYDENTNAFLFLLIEDTDALKNQLMDIRDTAFSSRSELQRALGNAHMGFAQYLNRTISFYECYDEMK